MAFDSAGSREARAGPSSAANSSAVAEIERASQRSRVIASRFDLDDTKDNPREGKVSMRWTLLAMIEEFARHAGHGDILREQIDKATPQQPNP